MTLKFIRSALQEIRGIYYDYLAVILHRMCLEMLSDRRCSSLRPSIAKDFEGGIHLGIGGFNLVSTRSIMNLLSDFFLVAREEFTRFSFVQSVICIFFFSDLVSPSTHYHQIAGVGRIFRRQGWYCVVLFFCNLLYTKLCISRVTFVFCPSF